MSIFKWVDIILKNNEYETIDITEEVKSFLISKKKEYEFALYRGVRHKAQYILVIDVCEEALNDVGFIKKQMSMYKSLIKANEKLEIDFDKNVSLLLCVNTDIDDETVEKQVLGIEEDPYCFKKLVLTYTDEEVEILEKRDRSNIWDYILSRIEKIKNEEEINYSDIENKFVFKLLMKLPFIPVDIVKKEKREKLLKQIEDKLEKKHKLIWDDIKKMESSNIEELKNYSEEQIEEILDKWYTEEE